MAKEKRLLTLDAMRGVAALLVVTFYLPAVGLTPSGYLAVDFFFVLSGFVIANAYDAQVLAGLPATRFMAHRLIRLYPLYLVGFVLGLLRAIGQSGLHRPDQLTPAHLAVSAWLEALLLPSPSNLHLFSLDGPAWSLFFEAIASFAYVAFLARLNPGALRWFLVVSGVALTLTIVTYQAGDMGYSWQTVHVGLARVSFSFAMGMFLARHRSGAQIKSALAPVLVAALVALMCMDFEGRARMAYDEIFVFLASPALVHFGARCSPAAALKPVCRWLGEISYPLYATHYPLLWMFGFAARKLGAPPVVWMPTFVILAVAVAALLARFWDIPVRRWLTQRIERRDIRTSARAP